MRAPLPTTRLWGIGLLALAAATYVAMTPSWPAIMLAAAAWIALARDRAIGPLPAAAAIVLALPYDRAADLDLLRLASIPVRPHDVVLGMALLASLPNLGRIRWTPASWLLAGFLVLGICALGLGIVNNHALRDILRDARWWGLYAGGLFLAGAGARPAHLLRGVLLGLTVYCVLLIFTALLPGVEGGLKLRAMAFDVGILRLHFGPTAFLLIPAAYWSTRLVIDRRRRLAAVGLGLAALGIGLSLTRVTNAVLFVVVLATLAVLVAGRRPRPPRLAGPLLVAAAGVALAFAINAIGVQVPTILELAGAEPSAAPTSVATATPTPSAPSPTGPSATPTATPATPTGPLARFTFDVEQLLLAVTDRFESYRNAAELIATSPLIGHGMGTLVEVEHEFGAGEFDTPGHLPNVDNAYLTMGMKAGVVGIVAFALMILWPVLRLGWHASRRATRYLLPAWLGLLLLTLTQGFAVSGHSPFVLGLLVVAIGAYPLRPGAAVLKVTH